MGAAIPRLGDNLDVWESDVGDATETAMDGSTEGLREPRR